MPSLRRLPTARMRTNPAHRLRQRGGWGPRARTHERSWRGEAARVWPLVKPVGHLSSESTCSSEPYAAYITH